MDNISQHPRQIFSLKNTVSLRCDVYSGAMLPTFRELSIFSFYLLYLKCEASTFLPNVITFYHTTLRHIPEESCSLSQVWGILTSYYTSLFSLQYLSIQVRHFRTLFNQMWCFISSRILTCSKNNALLTNWLITLVCITWALCMTAYLVPTSHDQRTGLNSTTPSKLYTRPTQRLSGPPPIHKLGAENHMLQL